MRVPVHLVVLMILPFSIPTGRALAQDPDLYLTCAGTLTLAVAGDTQPLNFGVQLSRESSISEVLKSDSATVGDLPIVFDKDHGATGALEFTRPNGSTTRRELTLSGITGRLDMNIFTDDASVVPNQVFPINGRNYGLMVTVRAVCSRSKALF
jgi:hypothetical protein